MTNKLVVIINSLKVPKIKKILLYEMKFLVPNYRCLQNPWLGGYLPRSPFSLSSNEFVEPPPPNKIAGNATAGEIHPHPLQHTSAPEPAMYASQLASNKQVDLTHRKNSKQASDVCNIREVQLGSQHLCFAGPWKIIREVATTITFWQDTERCCMHGWY